MINNYSITKLGGKKLTFFTTGTVARTMPDILKQMIHDGHEVGSHYNLHDLMYKQSNYEIAKNLSIAKESIFNACGQEPIGFRAPVFSITPDRLDIFEEINKFFRYDSSHVLNLNQNNKGYYENLEPFSSIDLIEFPIVPKGYMGGRAQIKSGGTFLRLFSKKVIKDVMEYNHFHGFTPQVYMHPYDYLSNQEFWVSFKEFSRSKKMSSLIKYFRQNQWSRLGNSSVFNKLDYILEYFDHQGTMSSSINV
ncbi:polysaccharide deacetylase family protein [Gammaproteobacteria bacterium]|mgnify:FL=1|nr:polysaccharide deacetylase family protein [Gammaproteobacteria bacterium]MDA9964347.1 polysaccharide deacetylase family protein [Gammaproteobacteria bacterium]